MLECSHAEDTVLRAKIGQRFFSTTRGRIVFLVRRSARTVDELAEFLGLTRNAVREHLSTLERDGLVHRSGTRQGGGKPAQLYALTPEAVELFPRGYAPMLGSLLKVLAERLSSEELQVLVRDAGRKIIAERPVLRGGPRERVGAGAELLNELGGLAEAREIDGSFVIQGWSCPLAALVGEHPELCLAIETILADVIGLPVQERCDRREPPRCFFTVTSTSSANSRVDRSQHPANPTQRDAACC